MGRTTAIAVLMNLALFFSSSAISQPNALIKPPPKTCADIARSEQSQQIESYPIDIFAFNAGFYREWIAFTTRLSGGHLDQEADSDALSSDDEARFLRAYCAAHPSNQFSEAMDALAGERARVAAAITANLLPSPAPILNVDAPEDVRDYVLKLAPQSASGRLKDNPSKDERTGIALGRDPSGKLVHIPDFTYVLTTAINGEGFNPTESQVHPLPLKGLKQVADIFIHSEIRDKPPGGNDDQLMRPGVPLFIIGDRGLDVWEMGLAQGVVSVRSLSWSVTGPWEPFKSDRNQYKIYDQRYLDGRTIKEDFPRTNDENLVNAVCEGNRKDVAAALKNGANANTKGVEGDTPLFWALDCGELENMEVLLKAGADPNYRLPWTGSPTNIASLPRQYSVLYDAVDTGNLAAVKLLLKFGGDPNTYHDEPGSNTALQTAFYDGEGSENAHDARAWDMYELLLNADKDINRADSSGQTIAITALNSRRFDKLKELLERGYNHDLAGLARQIWGYANIPPDPQAIQVAEFLKRKGVDVPPRQVMITVRMETDGSLDYSSENGRSRILKSDPRYDKVLTAIGPLEPGEQKRRAFPENALPK